MNGDRKQGVGAHAPAEGLPRARSVGELQVRRGAGATATRGPGPEICRYRASADRGTNRSGRHLPPSDQAGQSKNVRVTLNRTGRRLLAQKHRLTVKLTVTDNGRSVTTKTLVFKAKARHKHR